ncbi:UPF0488 protein CG14286 [Leptidea sinapis]|uniref:Uncharacterized protein n=1 Tax=Leptidea sinapis TaxID=189913 RepID=A0A5E4QTS2_9NEOP|nr:UPF0488 protein CG14286 [Leptidea sinapis]VVD01137.1 unnamed protein product [Leptidea sinapis]
MPKITKLHSTVKSKHLQKPTKAKDSSEQTDPEESQREFQLQLVWCIQQLERTLAEKKGNEKQLQEIWKVLTILKNNNQPIVRKRQLMRTHLGDYRAKMAAEEKKLVKMASKIKISESPAQPKATFLRKSAFLSTGESSFQFNFDVPPQSCNDKAENSPIGDGNTENSKGTDKKIAKDSVAESNHNKCKFISTSGSGFMFNFKVDDS